MKKQKRWREREFWRGASQEDRYEYLVDGPAASDEIRSFHEAEEKILIDLLQNHVERKEKIALIEIGCGPGRVIRRVARLITERPTTWGDCIEYIVGVDFEIEMIERAIANLILKERKIRDWTIYGAAYEISTATGVPLKEVRETLRKRVAFIDADARLPFLQCESITPVVAIMFGTLGNIPKMERVLKTVSEMCWPKGETLIVGFDRAHHEIGSERYRKLAERQFKPLHETKWDDKSGVFESPGGFYSQWFSLPDIKKILHRYFGKECAPEPISRSGFYVVAKPKSTIPRIWRRVLVPKSQKIAALQLLCPHCGSAIHGGSLPLPKVAKLTCTEQSHYFKVVDIMGFQVPRLEVE